jgi:Putative phage metallopeptidase
MPTTYEPATDLVTKLADRVMREHHPGLHAAKVQVGYLMAHAPRDANDEPKGPAIKLRGRACKAVVRIVNLKDRVAGLPDAMVILDGDEWDEWSEREQAAIIDHELTHLELKTDESGAVQRDDIGRPKLRMRLHDFEFGGFLDVAKHYGDDSTEKQVIADWEKNYKQILFSWG